ncbi:MAG: hypothetical protein ACI9KN_000284 [Gammaproteobacteria bacterium]|jgi:hypothetical protein
MKKLLIVLVAGFALYGLLGKNPYIIDSYAQESSGNNQQIASAYKNRQSDLQVRGSGVVIQNLEDDIKGSQHQKFIIKLSSGQTLLVAHNIDLAPRINSLREGDRVEFYGEYEWNAKGGVLHWTHHDPDGRHQNGWLKHNGARYQ